ncbi:MAG: N-6 DNA methylase [Planctomycetes bacterium]|nr:N-6 DNA methylase [Planctomycetota bacterium]
MARAEFDPHVLAHLEWLGFVQPTGLVVSALALVRAGAILDRRDAEGQRLLRACLAEGGGDGEPERVRERPPAYAPPAPETGPRLASFRAFAAQVLGWSFSPRFYAGAAGSPIPPELELSLPDYGETLRPDVAVREPEPEAGAPAWQLLVAIHEDSEDFDRAARGPGRLEASPHGRMERLLRHTGTPAGLLVNGRTLRLLSAPRGESSGWLDFRVADLAETAGRPISAALRLLLGETRLLSVPREKRLTALLESSRRFQNEVSERLAEQVLHALYELLRGFQAAHDASHGELLRGPLAEDPDEVYRALLTVILRLVFLLYAEERDMLPKDETFLRGYSLAGLHQRLREDAALHPDTMDQRYGAWAGLLVLFRMIHDGAAAGAMRLPRRRGALFDPDRFPFLEGRAGGGARQLHERIEPPLVPDGTIWRALEKLLVLDGERISYRALDVEQIGSVYETMMGFRLETASGRSAAIRAQKKRGAPATVDLEALLAEAPCQRARSLQALAGRNFGEALKKAVAAACTVEDLRAALDSVIDAAATPDLVPQGALVLQPSEERRRSGSHYTPRALTEPIVRTALEPVLARLQGASAGGRPPRPEAILDLKVLDPAMGSGAFLVEACRQLGDLLVEAWRAWGELPEIPGDEDEVVFARRLVAQRCLYGVDRNPVAVDLAKMSLWLVTLARDHPLTFVDHALRHGDSLVGLSRRQIEAFHWQGDAPRFQAGFEALRAKELVAKAAELRRRIREAGEGVSDFELRDLWDEAQSALGAVRLLGDLVLAAFFDAEKPKEREGKRSEYANAVARGEAERYRGWLEERRHEEPPLAPFHWEIEFPEVFERENPGFDAVVGNPPFMGGTIISTKLGEQYRDWLYESFAGAKNRCDLVAYFFRRAFDLIRTGGMLGLIATNTIAQGDTRAGGLRWICNHGGQIYSARKRVKWPGLAAVVVSLVHVAKGTFTGRARLDDRPVDAITAFLFHRGGHDDPPRLAANSGKQFEGVKIYGQGFTFDDTDKKAVATPISEMRRLIAKDPRNQEAIFPYIGGEEVNTSPTHAHDRYVINFGERSEEECRRQWPDLMAIAEAKVKPERGTKARDVAAWPWWQFWRVRGELQTAIAGLERVLVISQVTQHVAFAFLPGAMVYSHRLYVMAAATYATFGVLQSSIHEIWARFFGSSLEDRFMYATVDCFETFPFPEGFESHPALEAAGRAYYDFRAALMVRNNEGLTKTYNRFHDPAEGGADILKLRDLHAAMDRAVLDAYGWTDIPLACEFLLDYDIDEEEWGDKKKPWRCRWPDPVRDEVLARLLDLNASRAKAEARSGAARGNARKGARRSAPGQARLWEKDDG